MINLAVLQYDDSRFSHMYFSGPQFRYKTRVYKQTNLDEKALSKLSTKVLLFVSVEHCWCMNFSPTDILFLPPLFFISQASLKKFLDYIQTGAIEKMAKVLDKGLDSNFQDPDSGGEFVTTLTLTVYIHFLNFAYRLILLIQIKDFRSGIG